MDTRGTGRRLLGAFTQALDALGAKPKLVGALERVESEVIPKLETLVRDVDRAIDRAAEIKHDLRGMKNELADEEN
jgi:hypothetical protein